eukprot:scaffold587_cov77-Cylindrotheca_fusiformis.AAC.4
MEVRNNKRKSVEVVGEMNANTYFVYTSATEKTDIPKKTLTHLRVDSSVTEIPKFTFDSCRSLVQVQFPETLARIGRFAFSDCSNLKSIQFISDVSLSSNDNVEDGTIVFPESVKLQIESLAFSECHSLRKVIVCSTSTQLGSSAFNKCMGLISVELPEGLQLIEQGLFGGCRFLTTVIIASSVIKIGNHAFSGCLRLASLDFPHGLLTIGEGSFEQCVSIETLHIPPTVSTIGESAFSWCSGLKHIKLPPTLERIESYMFSGCGRLESIEIPSTVSFIGQRAFSECDSLSHIRIPPSMDRMMHWALEDCRNLISIELPEGLSINDTNNEEFVDGGTSGVSLVNLAIPPTEDFESMSGELYNYSKLGRVVEDEPDLLRKLKHRFENCPLNKLCYYQSYYSLGDAMMQLRTSLMEDGSLAATSQLDEFGMTPLHILSLSQTPNLDMILGVMEGGSLDHVIDGRDSFGSTPMDYLCLNRTPASTEVIRRVLQTRFDHLLGLARPWKPDMLKAVDEALEVEWSSRRRNIGRVYLKLADFEQKEIISIVELYLWKVKIDEASTKEQTVNREFCRVNSGASIVIPHVLSFLDNLDHYSDDESSEDETSEGESSEESSEDE